MTGQETKTYHQLSLLKSFEDRYNYLKCSSRVGQDTFGFDRYLNQMFYTSKEWKQLRNYIIVRDNGCDMGLDGYPIIGTIYIHHINPITIDDLENGSESILDPNNLVCVSYETHNAIHYGTNGYENKNKIISRSANDTCPWKK